MPGDCLEAMRPAMSVTAFPVGSLSPVLLTSMDFKTAFGELLPIPGLMHVTAFDPINAQLHDVCRARAGNAVCDLAVKVTSARTCLMPG